MKAGRLRHRGTFQKPGPRIDDGAAGGSAPYVNVAEVYASIEPLTGRELFQAGQFDPRLSHRVGTRYIQGVKPSWRFVYGDVNKLNSDNESERPRVFDIKSVADIEERHRELELMCEELVTW